MAKREPNVNEKTMNLAIFLPNWIGDVVMATPAIRALRERHADARIVAVCRPYVAGVLEGAPWFDDQLFLDSWLAAAWKLRRARIDMAVLLPNSFRSGLIAWL